MVGVCAGVCKQLIDGVFARVLAMGDCLNKLIS